ncbi:hypothetical protein HMSSN036_69300 [Paenibacillus macerans]|nr:hypothetical protein HMSSN036_69300 [Paenibacillus macerans]
MAGLMGSKKKISETELAQRLSPRSKKSSWTELNKERVRRLEKLGLMRDEGRKVLPDMNPDSFHIDKGIEQRLKEEMQVYENFMAFPDLYIRVRIDTIQSVKNQPELFKSRMVAILHALREGQEVTNAKLDGMEQRLSLVEGEVKGVKESVDFLVHKMGEHDRDLYVLKTKHG